MRYDDCRNVSVCYSPDVCVVPSTLPIWRGMTSECSSVVDGENIIWSTTKALSVKHIWCFVRLSVRRKSVTFRCLRMPLRILTKLERKQLPLLSFGVIFGPIHQQENDRLVSEFAEKEGERKNVVIWCLYISVCQRNVSLALL